MSDISNPSQPQIKTFQVDALSVRVYNRETELAVDVAQIAHHYLQNILDHQETATLLLATGNSQIKFLKHLIDLGGIDWSRINCFHLDEYLGIDANHPGSFRHYLQQRVENLVKPKQFYYIKGDATEPLKECDRYSQLLQTQPIDLCCLGLGENGHLAFNEPTVADFDDPDWVKLVKLDPLTRQQQVNSGYFPNLEAVPQYAFTLTLPALGSAKKILCIAPEQRKAKAVQNLLEGTISNTNPASFLRRQSHAILFLDTESASLLKKTEA